MGRSLPAAAGGGGFAGTPGAGSAAPPSARAPLPPRPKKKSRSGPSFDFDFSGMLSGGGTAVKVLAGLLVVAGLVYGAMYLGIGSSEDLSTYPIYVEFWNEFKKLRSEGADASTWDDFDKTISARLRPKLIKLEKTATANRAAEQALMFAGRDCVPKMIEKGRKEQIKEEKFFIQHMERVRRITNDPSLPVIEPDPNYP